MEEVNDVVEKDNDMGTDVVVGSGVDSVGGIEGVKEPDLESKECVENVVDKEITVNNINTVNNITSNTTPILPTTSSLTQQYNANENKYYTDIAGINKLTQLVKIDTEPNQNSIYDAIIIVEAIKKESKISDYTQYGRYIPCIDFNPTNIHVDDLKMSTTSGGSSNSGGEFCEYSVNLGEIERARLLLEMNDDVEFIQSIMGYKYSLQCVAVKRLTEGSHTSPGGVFGSYMSENSHLGRSSSRNTLISRHDMEYNEQFQPLFSEYHTPINKQVPSSIPNSTSNSTSANDNGSSDDNVDSNKNTQVESKVEVEQYIDPYLDYSKLHPTCVPKAYYDASTPDVEYYFSFVNIFESYEIEDKLKK